MSLNLKLLIWIFLTQTGSLAAFSQSDVAVTYFSGPSGGIGSRDGQGTNARFYGPTSTWADGQNVYVADAGNYTIRKISIATSQVTTIAGSPQQSGDTDGVGAAARFYLLGSIWGDGVNLYVSDGCRMRKVVIATGEVTSFAGRTLNNCQTVDGPATVAQFNPGGPLWGDGAYLYYVDPAVSFIRLPPLPGTLRIISLPTGDTTSIPLPLISTGAGSLSPKGIWGKDDYLYLTWFSSPGSLTMSRINMTTRQLEWLFNLQPPDILGYMPVGLWFDGTDSFYYVEKDMVRRFRLSTGATTSIATLPSATFVNPTGLTGAGDDLYVCDQFSQAVSRIHIPTGQVAIFAGLSSTAPHTPQDNVTAQSGFFHGVWSNSNNLYVARDGDILKIDPVTNNTTVFATGFGRLGGVWGDGSSLYVVNTDGEEIDRISLTTAQSTTFATGFGSPLGIWGDSTYLYVTGDHAIRRVKKTTGEVTVFAGSPQKIGSVDGIGTEAGFSAPAGIWGDSTYLYVADNGIRRVRLSTAEVTTMTTSAPLPELFGMAGDGTNLYVEINGLSGATSVVRIVIATGEAITLTQFAGSPLWADGQSVYIARNFIAPALDKITLATNLVSRVYPPLRFSNGVVPSDQIPVDVRWSDGQFLYGMFGAAIYKVRINDGTIIHVAGVFEETGLVDGIGKDARFGNPTDLWGDGTYLYVVGDARIRRVNIATQQVDTMVGGFVPNHIWGDGQGNLYLSDRSYRSIEKTSIVAPAIVPIAGSLGQPGASDFVDGVGPAAHFSAIGAIWGDGVTLFIVDGCSVRKMAIVTLAVTSFVGIPNSCSHVDGSLDIARFNTINDIWGNNGVLYVASPHTIRAIDLTTGDTLTIAGDPVLIGTEDGSGHDARFLGPKRVMSDGVNLYVSDNGIRKISFPVSMLPFTLSANGGSHWNAISSDAAITTGYVQLNTVPGSSNPKGVAVFSFRSNGVLVSEAAVPASPAIQSGRIYVDIGSKVKTGIAIVNPNDSDGMITFYFTDANGTNFGNGITTIAAHQQMNGFLDGTPWNGAANARSFTFTSSLPVGAIALRGLVNERSDFLMTTLPIVPLTLPAVAQVVLPQFASGGGWSTEILLVNPTNTALSGSVVMDSMYPYTVAPRSATKVVTSSQASAITTGTVFIVPAALNSPPVATSVFSFTTGAVVVTQTGVAANDVAQSFRLLAESDSSHSLQTGVAIANTSSAAAAIQLQLLDLNGQPAGFSGSVTVPANGHLAAFLHELPGLQNLPASFRGILQCTSTVSITMIGLRLRYNEHGDLLISTTPAVADSTLSSGVPFLFPHIAVGGGYSTELILLSPATPASGTLIIRSNSGAELPLPWVP